PRTGWPGVARAAPGTAAQRLALLQEHERAVRARIEELDASLEIIHGKVLAYEKHVREGTAAGVWVPGPSR
ncbi:MerR family transcriptional regulator, partial [Streptomyces lasiicapitis]